MHLMTLSRLAVLAASCLIIASPVQAQSSAVMAKVNGVSIPQSRLEFIVKARESQGQADTPETNLFFINVNWFTFFY